MEQIYNTCRITLNEYLYPTPYPDSKPSTGVRCPRGDRACDAQNLGWFMKSLAELGLLPTVLQLPVPSYPPAPQAHMHTQSLQQVIDALSLITSPPGCHGGICDFAPAFHSAINDVYESLTGLTLFDVTGKHGWALSKNGAEPSSSSSRRGLPGTGAGADEELFRIAAGTAAARQMRYAPGCQNQYQYQYQYPSTPPPRPSRHRHGSGKGKEYDDDDESHDEDDACYYKILSFLDDPRDLRAAALVNKRFYRSYRRNEARLRDGMPGKGKGKVVWKDNIYQVNGNMPSSSSSSRRRVSDYENNNHSHGHGHGRGYNNDEEEEEDRADPLLSAQYDWRRRSVNERGEGKDERGEEDAVPRQEKFIAGQVWVLENKQLVEPEAKAHASLRHRLLGRRTSAKDAGGSSSGRRFSVMR